MTVTVSADTVLNRVGQIQQRRRWQGTAPQAVALLIHGLAEHSGRYDHVGRFLAERGIDVVAIDLRGFGLSGGRRAHVDRFDDFLDDVEDRLGELRTLGLPVVLVGHSMGGLICSGYAVSERPPPDLLVLSGPALAVAVPRWQRWSARVLTRLAPRLRVPNRLKGRDLATDPAVAEAYFADALVCTSSTVRLGAEMFAAMEETRAAVSRLTIPTLVLHGADDRIVQSAASAPLDGLDGVTRIVYPGLRHEIFNEPAHPEILGTLVDWVRTQLSSM